MYTIEILSEGEVQEVIIADADFATQHYGNNWRFAKKQEMQAPNETGWLIDIGPFFDRFGAAKMQILTSSDPGVKAIISDLQVRKWIDLKRVDVQQGVQYVGTVVPSVDSALINSILNNPVQPEENLALRKLYFQ